MGQFLTTLQVERVNDTYWRLLTACRFKSDVLNSIVEAPAGFITDFASVPKWIPLAYALFKDAGQPAAVIHDYLYQTQLVARPLADQVLREGLYACGEPAWKCEPMYTAVRLFGESHYGTSPARYQRINGPLIRAHHVPALRRVV